MHDARCSMPREGKSFRGLKSCLTDMLEILPQITQIDADVFLFVNLRYLRYLRADLGGRKIRNPASPFGLHRDEPNFVVTSPKFEISARVGG